MSFVASLVFIHFGIVVTYFCRSFLGPLVAHLSSSVFYYFAMSLFLYVLLEICRALLACVLHYFFCRSFFPLCSMSFVISVFVLFFLCYFRQFVLKSLLSVFAYLIVAVIASVNLSCSSFPYLTFFSFRSFVRHVFPSVVLHLFL